MQIISLLLFLAAVTISPNGQIQDPVPQDIPQPQQYNINHESLLGAGFRCVCKSEVAEAHIYQREHHRIEEISDAQYYFLEHDKPFIFAQGQNMVSQPNQVLVITSDNGGLWMFSTAGGVLEDPFGHIRKSSDSLQKLMFLADFLIAMRFDSARILEKLPIPPRIYEGIEYPMPEKEIPLYVSNFTNLLALMLLSEEERAKALSGPYWALLPDGVPELDRFLPLFEEYSTELLDKACGFIDNNCIRFHQNLIHKMKSHRTFVKENDALDELMNVLTTLTVSDFDYIVDEDTDPDDARDDVYKLLQNIMYRPTNYSHASWNDLPEYGTHELQLFYAFIELTSNIPAETKDVFRRYNNYRIRHRHL